MFNWDKFNEIPKTTSFHSKLFKSVNFFILCLHIFSLKYDEKIQNSKLTAFDQI